MQMTNRTFLYISNGKKQARMQLVQLNAIFMNKRDVTYMFDAVIYFQRFLPKIRGKIRNCCPV